MTNTSDTKASEAEGRRSFLPAFINLRDAGTLFGLALILIVFAVLNPVFMTAPNVLNILQQSSINACIALGMTFVIISGDRPLGGSRGGDFGRCGRRTHDRGGSTAHSIAGRSGHRNVVRVVQWLPDCLCGPSTVYRNLGGLSLYRALALIFTGGNPIFGIPTEFRAFINGDLLGVPVPVVIVGLIALLLWIVLNRTPFGEYILAVGGNQEAARIAGVPVARTRITVYVMSGGLAAVAALILMGRLGAADPTMGNLWELDAIAATAIGGVTDGRQGVGRRYATGCGYPWFASQRADADERAGVLSTSCDRHYYHRCDAH